MADVLTLGHIGRRVVVNENWNVDVSNLRQGSSKYNCTGEDEGGKEGKELHDDVVRVLMWL
jgi:hypothetical protein